MPSSCDHRVFSINKKDFLRGMTVAEMHHIRRAESTPRPLLREDGEQILQGAMACLLAVEEISSRCKVVPRGKSTLAPRETGTPLQIRFFTDAAPGRIPNPALSCTLENSQDMDVPGLRLRHYRRSLGPCIAPVALAAMFPQLSEHFLHELAPRELHSDFVIAPCRTGSNRRADVSGTRGSGS